MAETITVSLYPNGDVRVEVNGVKGKKCLELTKELTKQLGIVKTTKKSEYYQEEKAAVKQSQGLGDGNG